MGTYDTVGTHDTVSTLISEQSEGVRSNPSHTVTQFFLLTYSIDLGGEQKYQENTLFACAIFMGQPGKRKAKKKHCPFGVPQKLLSCSIFSCDLGRKHILFSTVDYRNCFKILSVD